MKEMTWKCEDIEKECPYKKGKKCIELTIATCPMLKHNRKINREIILDNIIAKAMK